MFVQNNTLEACLGYVSAGLAQQFSNSEIRQIKRAIFNKLFNFKASDLILRKDYRLTESELLLVREMVKRLQSNEPLQYVVGNTEFCDLTLRCDRRALIPRPETEELVWKTLELIENEQVHTERILDLCSGSGCIALALKNKIKSAEVWALDYSTEALDLARENAREVELDVRFLQGDALKLGDIPELKNLKWSLIVANPPYIPNSEKHLLAANVLDYEPHIALFVEDLDPLIFYKRIAEFAISKLEERGVLAFELHENLAQQTADFCTKLGFSSVEIFEDLQGKQRILLARV
jgi:release factor glutamine methyltransferase